MSSLHLKLSLWNSVANPIDNSRVTSIAAYEGGIACGYSDGKVWLYDLTTDKSSDNDITKLQICPKTLLIGHQEPIALLAISEVGSPVQDGCEEALISVSNDGSIFVWGTDDGRCLSESKIRLQGIKPTSINIQAVEYESVVEDILFISGEGNLIYALSFPSLETLCEWEPPHPEWVTALAIRKRRDHFRSELISCAQNGAMRIWSYDEFSLSQSDTFSRAITPQSPVDYSPQGNISPDGDVLMDSDADVLTHNDVAIFSLESTFPLGPENVVIQMVVNPYNEDEFLAVSPNVVRLFASRDNELHELLRWKAQRGTKSQFSGGAFLSKSDIIFWDELGNTFSVCSSFTIEGGTAGMHLNRSTYSEDSQGAIVSAINAVMAPSSWTQCCNGPLTAGRTNVLISYCNSTNVLSLRFPPPLSSVSGSANNPQSLGAKDRSKIELEKPAAKFDMANLWCKWLDGISSDNVITSTMMSEELGNVVIGYESGEVRITTPRAFVSGPVQSDRPNSDKPSDLSEKHEIKLVGHSGAITALYEWVPDNCSRRRCSIESLSRVVPDLSARDNFICSECGKNDEEGSCNCTDYSCDSDNAEYGTQPSVLLISASKDLTVRVWNPVTGECLATILTQGAPIVQFSPIVSMKPIFWTNNASSQQQEHQQLEMEAFLKSHILCIGSDNSTVLVSMDYLEPVYVTAPFYERPTRISLSKNGMLCVQFGAAMRQRIDLKRLLTTEELKTESECLFPSYVVNLQQGYKGTSSRKIKLAHNRRAQSKSRHWFDIRLLSHNYSVIGYSPVVELDFDISRLQLLVAKAIPENARMEQVQRIIDNERKGVFDTQPLGTALGVLSSLLTWNVSEDLDSIKRVVFAMQPPLSNISLSITNPQTSAYSLLFSHSKNPRMSWCVSSFLNSQRMLAILVLSRCILQGDERKAVEIINFYVGRLPSEIGQKFKPLSLLALSQYWQSTNTNLQRAARTLFLSAVHNASEKHRRVELFYWSSVLARCTPSNIDEEGLCALTIVSIIGADFPSLLPLTSRNIASSILQALIISDTTNSKHRMLAAELIARGFATFKPYMDCQLVIRCLLRIMMSVTDKTSGNFSNLGIYKSKSGVALTTLGDSLASAPASRNASRAATPSDLGRAVNRSDSSQLARIAMTSSARLASNLNSSDAGYVTDSAAVESGSSLGPNPSALDPDNSDDRHDAETFDGGNKGIESKHHHHHHHRHHHGHAHGGIPVKHRHRQGSRGTELASSERIIGESGSSVSFNLVALAKSALLRICTSDTSLMSSTIIEILQNEEDSIRERKGALQLIGLISQKYPVQIYPYLNDIVRAAVQSIEPKRASVRKELIKAAGGAFQGLVRTYNWVSFNSDTQCLAIGCVDGRCTCYDLRTATRSAMYDDGSGSPVVAVALSPKGDLVASFCLGSRKLSIWDPSPSTLAMFARSLFRSTSADSSDNAGNANHSSHGTTVTPNKTMTIPMEFLDHVDDLPMSSLMTVAKLRWTANRTVLLQIQSASFSLSV